MTSQDIKLFLSSIFVLMIAVTTAAQEKRITRADLPAAVQKTADEQSKGATVRGYTSEKYGNKAVYEMEMMIDGRAKDVSIGANGGVLEVEEEVSLNKLPREVRGVAQDGEFRVRL